MIREPRPDEPGKESREQRYARWSRRSEAAYLYEVLEQHIDELPHDVAMQFLKYRSQGGTAFTLGGAL